MKTGTIVTAEFQGVVSTKRRPAVVVSSEKYHRERPDAILALITSQTERSLSSTDYILQDWESANLNKPSAIRVFLFTLPQNTLTEIGELSEKDWAQVKIRLQIALDF